MVDAALALAEETSWEAVRLHALAARLDLSLQDVRQHFREKEEIADAFFQVLIHKMESAAPEVDVPVLAEGGQGTTWGQAH